MQPETKTATEVLSSLQDTFDDNRVDQSGSVVPARTQPRQQVLPAHQQEPPRKPGETTLLEMSTPSDMGEFFADLAQAQAEFGVVERTLTAKIKSRREGGADFAYDYAPLDAVLAAVRPPLNKHGFSVMQFPQTRANNVLVRTLVNHKSGKYIFADCVVPCQGGSAQDIGSAITYARRYGLQAMLGIAPDHDDDDGAAASGSRPSEPRHASGSSLTESASRGGHDRVKITTVREQTRNGQVFYGVKSTAGEAWTDDKALAASCREACTKGKPVQLVTEKRLVGTQTLSWLTEMLG